MTSRGSLLRDLAALVRRYPSREWLQLLAMLEDDRTRSEIISILKEFGEELASSAKANRKVRSENPKPPRESNLDSRERFELELSRSPIGKLRYIARGYGIKFSPKDSRQRLGRMILIAAGKGDLKLGGEPEAITARSQGDYAKWADIIIRGGRPRR